MITLSFRNQRELENFIVRVATPLAQKIAKTEAENAVSARFSFRAKKDSASATSSYGMATRNPVGGQGGNIGNAGTVTGSTAGNVALQRLLAILDSMAFIKNETT